MSGISSWPEFKVEPFFSMPDYDAKRGFRIPFKSERRSIGIAYCWACRSYTPFEKAWDRCEGHFIEHAVDDTNWRCMGSGTPVGKLGSRTPDVLITDIKIERKWVRVSI